MARIILNSNNPYHTPCFSTTIHSKSCFDLSIILQRYNDSTTGTSPHTKLAMNSSRPSIRRPSQVTPDFTLSPTSTITHSFGSPTSTPIPENDLYATPRTVERSYGPSVTVGGTTSPSRQVPADLLMPDFWLRGECTRPRRWQWIHPLFVTRHKWRNWRPSNASTTAVRRTGCLYYTILLL